MRILKEEKGQVLVLTALSMTVLMGFMGMAADVGALFHDKRNQQTAVDAAAIAGALDYKFNANAASAQAAAKAAATANGVPDVSYLTVNVPPQNGPNQNPGFVEAILTEPRNTMFMSLFGFHTVNVTARAVATASGAPSQGCVYILDPTASYAMDLQGSFNVDAPGCGIEINSNSASALHFTGAGGSMTAGWIAVNGGASGQTGDSTPAPTTYTNTPISDPYGGVDPLPVNASNQCSGPWDWTLDGKTGSTSVSNYTPTAAETSAKKITLTGTVNLSGSSNSDDGIIAQCYPLPVNISNATLGPGIYVFLGGVTLSGSVATNNATLDIQQGGLTIPTGGVSFGTANNSATGLIAPTAGPTNGIALMEPVGNTSQIMIQKGNATGNITGDIYAPSAQLYLQDSGGDKTGGLSLYSDIIVGTLFDKTATMQIHNYSSVAPTDPNTTVTLVE